MKDRRVVTGALAVGTALGIASTSEAATFTVSSNADSGPDTLRQAVIDANTAAGADTITFNASLTGDTITLTSGQIDITDSVDIQGLGSANLTVSGNSASRVFYVYNPAAPPIDVTISGLTITDAHSVVAGDPAASAGGAIRDVGENLTLDDVDITSSIAGGDGGGVAHFAVEDVSSYTYAPATLTISDSTISENAANFVDIPNSIDQGGCGGGVWVGGAINVQLDHVTLTNNDARCEGGGFSAVYMQPAGQITISNSVITGNEAGLGGLGSAGGGVSIFAHQYDVAVSITDTTISGNEVGGFGGGVTLVFLGDFTIQRSTISGNVADLVGGGIVPVVAYGTIESSTIAENAAPYGYGGGMYTVYSEVEIKETTISGNTSYGEGPGIYAYDFSAITIHNSIVANNVGDTTQDLYDVNDSFFDVSYSLIENPGTAQIIDNGGNIFGDDPQLGPLQDNGGPTFTMKPANTSPVLDQGDPSFTPPPSTDQRGFARVVGPAIDMGAVELDASTVQFTVAAQNVNEDTGTVTVTVSRTGGADNPASVAVSLSGTSTATGGGTDHDFGGTVLNWADNDAAPKSFDITITDDPFLEPAETIVLTLGSPTGASLGATTTHTVTIADNDVGSADLRIAKALAPGALVEGGTATFNITVTNDGPNPATNVTVTDTLPAQATLLTTTPASCTGTTVITCNVGTLNSGESTNIQIVVTLTAPGSATNVADVSSDVSDPDGTDNSGQVTFTILPAAATANIPALDWRMQMLLAAIVAATALKVLKR